MKTYITFALCLTICAFIGFMCGYDFDHRNINTGIFTTFSIMVATVATLMARGLA